MTGHPQGKRSICIKDLIDAALHRFSCHHLRLDAELLLCHLLGYSRLYLIREANASVSSDIENRFLELLEKRSTGVPLAYLTNQKEFYGHCFHVDETVLIPRPETEVLVEEALRLMYIHSLNTTGPLMIADCGTGSGCIAVSISIELKRRGGLFKMHAIEKSPTAFRTAEKNVNHFGLDGFVYTINADWNDFLSGGFAYDFIVSNPPYVMKEDPLNSAGIQFEPEEALYAVENGLKDIFGLITLALINIKKGGYFLCEIGYNHSASIDDFLDKKRVFASNLGSHYFVNDLAGIKRVLVVSVV